MARQSWKPSPEELKKVEMWAALGLNQNQIAHGLGIVPATLYKHKRSNEEFAEAMARGRARATAKAAARLMQEIDKPDGDLRAVMFFLRTVGGWREKGEVNVNHSGVVGIEELRDQRAAAIKKREKIRKRTLS